MENAILNSSIIEEDPFAELSLKPSNISNTQEMYERWQPSLLETIMNYSFLFFELAKFFLGVAAFISDILLVYLILRYKRLRKTFNIYIVHYAIMNIGYYVVSPIILIIHLLVLSGFNFFIITYCFVGMLDETFLLMSFYFMFFLGLDWTISCFKPDLLNKIQMAYKFKFSILYAIFVFILLVNSAGCLLLVEISHYFLLFSMPIMIISLSAMHYVRRQKVLTKDHLKTEYSLWLSTIVLGCYVPIYILVMILRILDYRFNILTLLVIFLEYLFAFLPTANSIFVLYYLNKWNKYFKMAYDTTFKKSVRAYGVDNLDDASDNEEIVEDGGEKNTQGNSNGSDNQTIMVP